MFHTACIIRKLNLEPVEFLSNSISFVLGLLPFVKVVDNFDAEYEVSKKIQRSGALALPDIYIVMQMELFGINKG